MSSCSALSCAVGCAGALMPVACLAARWYSSSSSMYSSLYAVTSSKFVDPVHSMLSVALCFVVQSSSILKGRLPAVG